MKLLDVRDYVLVGALVIMAFWFSFANALNLGVIDVKGVTAKGLFLATDINKTWNEPVERF